MPKRPGAESSRDFFFIFRLVPKRLGAETSRAESSRCRNDLVPKRL